MARLALILWIVLAVVVWNVVFDQVITQAGRHYLAAAVVAAARGRPYLRMSDALRPAVRRAAADASLAAAATLAPGLAALLAARARAPQPPRPPLGGGATDPDKRPARRITG